LRPNLLLRIPGCTFHFHAMTWEAQQYTPSAGSSDAPIAPTGESTGNKREPKDDVVQDGTDYVHGTEHLRGCGINRQENHEGDRTRRNERWS